MLVGAESLFQMQVIGTLGVDSVQIETWQQEKNGNWILMCVSSAWFLNVALSMEVNDFSSAVNRECILYHHVWPVENTLLWCFVSRGFLCCSPRTDLGTVWGFLQEACAVNTALTSLGLLCCTDAAKNLTHSVKACRFCLDCSSPFSQIKFILLHTPECFRVCGCLCSWGCL